MIAPFTGVNFVNFAPGSVGADLMAAPFTGVNFVNFAAHAVAADL